MIDTTQPLTGSQYWFMHAEAPALAAQMKREFMEKRLRREIITMLPEPEAIRMVFRYDPILGLEYFMEPQPVLVYDIISLIPKDKNFDLDRLMHHMKRDKIMFINSSKKPDCEIDCDVIWSNF